MIPFGVLASARVAPTGGGGGFEFLAAASPASAATSHTFTVPLGGPSAGRTIVVCVVTQSAIGTVTIAGVTATKDVEHIGGSSTRAAVFRATVPTGTTGDVVVPIGASSTRCGVGVYRIGGAVTVASTDTAAAALTVAAGDFAVACAYATSASTTWTGGTRDYILSFSDYHTGASVTAASAGTLTLDPSSSLACAGAAYRLA